MGAAGAPFSPDPGGRGKSSAVTTVVLNASWAVVLSASNSMGSSVWRICRSFRASLMRAERQVR